MYSVYQYEVFSYTSSCIVISYINREEQEGQLVGAKTSLIVLYNVTAHVPSEILFVLVIADANSL